MRKSGIITILIGVGLFFISILLSEGYDQRRSLMGNIYAMELVITPGKLEKAPPSSDLLKMLKIDSSQIVGRIAISLNLLLCLSIVITLIGTGVVLVPRKKRKETA